MPTYEFRCPKGHEFEKFYRSISGAAHELACPTCGLTAERQMSGGTGLVFKGSGFYITDYGKDGKKSQTPRPEGAGSGESGGTKPDSAASTPAAESKPSTESKPTEPAKAPKSEARKSSSKDKSGE
jgi:putative FmdB family regulatory protein